jgi:hypothetical protein
MARLDCSLNWISKNLIDQPVRYIGGLYRAAGEGTMGGYLHWCREDSSRMHLRVSILLGLALLFAAPALALAHEPPSIGAERLQTEVTPGELLLTGSQVTSINDSSLPARYRVCMAHELGDADLIVRHDGEETRLKAGGCATVSGQEIELTPAIDLTGEQRIVATYRQLPKQWAQLP